MHHVNTTTTDFSISNDLTTALDQMSLSSTPKSSASGLPSSPSRFNLPGTATSSTIPNPVYSAFARRKLEARNSEARCTWSGQLPRQKNGRIIGSGPFSAKVFLGGVPYDITDLSLKQSFAKFGSIQVQWPVRNCYSQFRQKQGYVYIIFDDDKQVQSLLDACTYDFCDGGKWYYPMTTIPSVRSRTKEVQVIPWCTADSNYTNSYFTSTRNDFNQFAVFVGALHGMLTAEGLGRIMDDLFGGVVSVHIDTDKHKYPIGSGKVVFNNQKSFYKAVEAAFVEIKSNRFTKRIQIDPFLSNNVTCSVCRVMFGPIFCRNMSCFRYFCEQCWNWQHSVDQMKDHRPLIKRLD